jgi:hypothetical protein
VRRCRACSRCRLPMGRPAWRRERRESRSRPG